MHACILNNAIIQYPVQYRLSRNFSLTNADSISSRLPLRSAEVVIVFMTGSRYECKTRKIQR